MVTEENPVFSVSHMLRTFNVKLGPAGADDIVVVYNYGGSKNGEKTRKQDEESHTTCDEGFGRRF